MNIRQIIETAENDLDTYRHPNLDEALKIINEILEAAGLGSIENDTIEQILVSPDSQKGMVRISTSWVSRGCDQNADYEFPVWLLDAENYVEEAQKWGLQEKLAKYEGEVRTAERSLQYAQSKVDEVKRKLEALTPAGKEAAAEQAHLKSLQDEDELARK